MKFLKYILLAYACLMTLQVQAQSKEYTLIHQEIAVLYKGL